MLKKHQKTARFGGTQNLIAAIFDQPFCGRQPVHRGLPERATAASLGNLMRHKAQTEVKPRQEVPISPLRLLPLLDLLIDLVRVIPENPFNGLFLAGQTKLIRFD